MIGFTGRVKMVQAMQGTNPFADKSSKIRGPRARHVPPPDKLRPLTPEIFDAMFQGKAKKVRERQPK